MIFSDSCTFTEVVVPKMDKADCNYSLRAPILDVIYYARHQEAISASLPAADEHHPGTSPVVYGSSLATTFEVCATR
jgi:hypothetical protein